MLPNSKQPPKAETREIAPKTFDCGSPNVANPASDMKSSRRGFLQTAAGGTLAGLLTRAGMDLATPDSVRAQSTLSPDAALQELMNGNKRFTSDQLTSFEADLRILKQNTEEKQEPFAAVLSCADSRVPVELIFDQTIGQIFVTRVAGNVATSEIIASLEYGVAVLGVEVLLVLGHNNCGALKAAMKADSVPGQISALYPYLRPAVEQSGGDVDKAIATNAKIQAGLLRTSSPVIREAIKAGKLRVESGVYDLATGKVSLS